MIFFGCSSSDGNRSRHLINKKCLPTLERKLSLCLEPRCGSGIKNMLLFQFIGVTKDAEALKKKKKA
jgi:hypothetical protein